MKNTTKKTYNLKYSEYNINYKSTRKVIYLSKIREIPINYI